MAGGYTKDVQRGVSLALEGRRRELLGHLEQALAQRPRSPQALYLRGVLRESRQDDLPGAIADFDRVVALQPNHGYALCQRALARFKAGDTAGARADVDAAVDLLPDAARPYAVRSGLRAATGDLAGARLDVELALSRNPALVMAYKHRGDIEQLEGDDVGALADYEQVLRLQPKHPEGAALRSFIHKTLGRPSQY